MEHFIAIGVSLAFVLWVYLKGRKDGKSKERAKHSDQVINNAEKAKDVENRINNASDNERKRLRAKWTRK